MVVGQDLGITLDMENWWMRAGAKGIVQSTDLVAMGMGERRRGDAEPAASPHRGHRHAQPRLGRAGRPGTTRRLAVPRPEGGRCQRRTGRRLRRPAPRPRRGDRRRARRRLVRWFAASVARPVARPAAARSSSGPRTATSSGPTPRGAGVVSRRRSRRHADDRRRTWLLWRTDRSTVHASPSFTSHVRTVVASGSALRRPVRTIATTATRFLAPGDTSHQRSKQRRARFGPASARGLLRPRDRMDHRRWSTPAAGAPTERRARPASSGLCEVIATTHPPRAGSPCTARTRRRRGSRAGCARTGSRSPASSPGPPCRARCASGSPPPPTTRGAAACPPTSRRRR